MRLSSEIRPHKTHCPGTPAFSTLEGQILLWTQTGAQGQDCFGGAGQGKVPVFCLSARPAETTTFNSTTGVVCFKLLDSPILIIQEMAYQGDFLMQWFSPFRPTLYFVSLSQHLFRVLYYSCLTVWQSSADIISCWTATISYSLRCLVSSLA